MRWTLVYQFLDLRWTKIKKTNKKCVDEGDQIGHRQKTRPTNSHAGFKRPLSLSLSLSLTRNEAETFIHTTHIGNEDAKKSGDHSGPGH
jgi:hypothetical protein